MVDENASAPTTAVVRDENGWHTVTLTVDGEEQLFRQNRSMRMGLGILTLKLQVRGVSDYAERTVPLRVRRSLIGEAHLGSDSVEVIGFPSSHSNKVSLEIKVYDESYLDILRRNIMMSEEDFGKPTALLSPPMNYPEAGYRGDWLLSIHVSGELFSEIEKNKHLNALERISFNLDFNNVFCKAVRDADGYYEFIEGTHYVLQEDGFSWLVGKTSNVFIDYASDKNIENTELTHADQTKGTRADARSLAETFREGQLVNSIKMDRIVSRLNWLIGSMLLIACLLFVRS